MILAAAGAESTPPSGPAATGWLISAMLRLSPSAMLSDGEYSRPQYFS